jgi:alkylated DNA repair dioxygenase AlkB
MNLFQQHELSRNLLPYDGIVNYYGVVFSQQEIQNYFNQLMQGIVWQNDEAYIYGKHYITKRKVAWYADAPFSYAYSNVTKSALPWNEVLQAIKKQTETLTQETYNSCLLNLYHTGDEGMAWHSDDEKTLKKNGAIASLTFGAERKFSFKHKKTEEVVSLQLENGSLLMMKDVIQTFWLHRLPPTKKVKTPRINLTFRTIVGQ